MHYCTLLTKGKTFWSIELTLFLKSSFISKYICKASSLPNSLKWSAGRCRLRWLDFNKRWKLLWHSFFSRIQFISLYTHSRSKSFVKTVATVHLKALWLQAICTLAPFYYYHQNPFRFSFRIQIWWSQGGLNYKSFNLHEKAKPWRILVVVVKWRHHENDLSIIMST